MMNYELQRMWKEAVVNEFKVVLSLLRKPTNNLSYDTLILDRDLNAGPPE
jgi:hypothetical protein